MTIPGYNIISALGGSLVALAQRELHFQQARARQEEEEEALEMRRNQLRPQATSSQAVSNYHPPISYPTPYYLAMVYGHPPSEATSSTTTLANIQPIFQALSGWFPEGGDLISPLLAKHSAGEIQIRPQGIVTKEPQRMPKSKTLCTIEVPLINLIQSFLQTIKASKSGLYNEIIEKLPSTTIFLSDKFADPKRHTLTLERELGMTPAKGQRLTFSISAQKLIDLFKAYSTQS